MTPFWGMPFIRVPPMSDEETRDSFLESIPFPNLYIDTTMDSDDIRDFVLPMAISCIKNNGRVIIETYADGTPLRSIDLRKHTEEGEYDITWRDRLGDRIAYVIRISDSTDPEDISTWEGEINRWYVWDDELPPIDFDSLEDRQVTVRDRDTTE